MSSSRTTSTTVGGPLSARPQDNNPRSSSRRTASTPAVFVKPTASNKSSSVSDELAGVVSGLRVHSIVAAAPPSSFLLRAQAQRLRSGIPRAGHLPCSTEFELLLLGFCAPLQ
ncbi:hypothetical protein BV20DRAFT_1057537 [Pilatotrama ljubarskyi]|nr:hypothetical protein BV20DRAFT_1057537 [Pilatotrama ljubarskyi]